MNSDPHPILTTARTLSTLYQSGFEANRRDSGALTLRAPSVPMIVRQRGGDSLL